VEPLSIRFSGFGGQGIILMSVIMGTTVVTRNNLYSVQTQSYGSEARGGQCQAELIISQYPINSPSTQQKDLLVALCQSALDRYISTLKPGGVLIIDPKLVFNYPEKDFTVYKVPATESAIRIGNRIAANMVVLGFLQPLLKIPSSDDVKDVIKENVKEKFVDLNLSAFNEGLEIAKELNPTWR